MVIGFGGYPTIPIIFAGKLLNTKIVIHEQNRVIGRANKLMLNFCDKITTGHLTVKGIKEKYNDKILYTGNPIRPEIFEYINHMIKTDFLIYWFLVEAKVHHFFQKLYLIV